jgi:hypothetical protein
MKGSLLDSQVARKLWWLVHNRDSQAVFRTEVYRELQRGMLTKKLTSAESSIALMWVADELARIVGKTDRNNRILEQLTEFLKGPNLMNVGGTRG